MPRKVFQPAEVLQAAEVNTFLMDQAVMVFDDAAARDAAIPSPIQGMVTFLKDLNVLEAWFGDRWGQVSGAGSITVSETAPTGPDVEDGALWFNSVLGRTFIYYEDDDSAQWVEIGAGSGPTAAAVLTSAPTSAEQGQLWFDAETGNMYFYYVDNDSAQWIQVRSAAPVDDTVIPGKNLLYNGAMQVHQRGTSVTGVSTGRYLADRWQNIGAGNYGTYTLSIENDAPVGSGFAKSHKVLCTTALTSPASNVFASFEQRLEGQDLQGIKKGTANAEQLTLSFWVKSNVTGTYTIRLGDTDNGRSVSAAYTVSSSGTWEKKVITFPADTTGALDNDNALSLFVRWALLAGTDFTSGALGTTWASTTNANLHVGQVNVAAATNNYWQITGVQLETGPVATPFEFKPLGQELAECQRYYYRISASAITPFSVFAPSGRTTSSPSFIGYTTLPTTMRRSPISVEFGGDINVSTTAGARTITSIAVQDRSSNSIASTTFNFSSSLTTNVSGDVLANNDATAFLGFNAEL